MTYFATPNDKAAHVAGMLTAAYEAQEDAIVADLENLDAMGEPHLDPEDRRYVDEGDVMLVTPQDRDDLDTVLAWEEYHI